ncbi:TnsD family Tn7-like transposition protein [Psychrobacillus sp. PGGUH221]|uniref:TnsD family Tn7-like transposition protein n=1 Tax=Psychrobacillus sp. PGGUH221 TaxID=3020058 RepID=UPI0035C6A2A5
MINFLPTVYEDELLYSVFARYKRMCGMLSNEALINDLFGSHIIQRSIFFPQHINAFVSNLTPLSKFTAKEIIMKNTMLPFFSAFLSEEKTKRVYTNMVDGCGRGIETIIGFGGSKVNIQTYLRYCPICFQEDMVKKGESYWRRVHQIVGVMYCRKHRVRLKDSSVLSTANALNFICADEDVCNENVLTDNFSTKVKELNIQYIKASEQLLWGNYQRKDLQFIIRFYIDKLRDRGFASKQGSLYINEVQKRFLQYYPTEYLKIMQSTVDPLKETNWLRLFVRNNNKNRSPLRHLLYLQFLGVSVDKFFCEDRVEGKKTTDIKHLPLFEIEEMREKWLILLKENPEANRSQLKTKGKGLHTWIFRHDREWYEKVTPRVKTSMRKTNDSEWEERDKECLKLAKQAVERIMNEQGKPIRVTPLSIRRTVGERSWFNNERLKETHQFMREAKEEINEFRIRKIKWAIDELNKCNERITAYKIQRFVGFGGEQREVRILIDKVLKEHY